MFNSISKVEISLIILKILELIRDLLKSKAKIWFIAISNKS